MKLNENVDFCIRIIGVSTAITAASFFIGNYAASGSIYPSDWTHEKFDARIERALNIDDNYKRKRAELKDISEKIRMKSQFSDNQPGMSLADNADLASKLGYKGVLNENQYVTIGLETNFCDTNGNLKPSPELVMRVMEKRELWDDKIIAKKIVPYELAMKYL